MMDLDLTAVCAAARGRLVALINCGEGKGIGNFDKHAPSAGTNEEAEAAALQVCERFCWEYGVCGSDSSAIQKKREPIRRGQMLPRCVTAFQNTGIDVHTRP